MHEQQQGRQDKELDFTYSRSVRHRVSTIQRKNRLGTIAYFYSYDRSSRYLDSYNANKEFTNNAAIIVISLEAFATGVGIFVQQIFGIR